MSKTQPRENLFKWVGPIFHSTNVLIAKKSKNFNFNTNDYEQVWLISKTGNYLEFNINTSDEVIQEYQRAFDDIAKQRLSIKEYYELPQDEY